MREGPLLRLLELIRRHLEADDARIEIGGRPPVDPTLLTAPLGPHSRVVVVRGTAGDHGRDRETEQRRLDALVEGFAGLAQDHDPGVRAPRPDAHARVDLDRLLRALTARTRSVAALVLDAQSPVIWGSSLAEGPPLETTSLRELGNAAQAWHGLELETTADALPDVDALVAAGLARPHGDAITQAVSEIEGLPDAPAALRRRVLLARAVAVLRDGDDGVETDTTARRIVTHEPGFGLLARGFANLYWVALVFEGPYSELSAEGALVHALPAIERAVVNIPPLDPSPSPDDDGPRGGASVIRLEPPR